MGPALAADTRLSPHLTAEQAKVLASPPPSPRSGSPWAAFLARFDVAMAQQNVRRLHAAGVRILAGDDAPNLSAFGVSMHGELALLTAAGLTPVEALAAATRAPADAFRLDEIGRILPGARADLILVRGDPTTDIEATRAIARIFKSGFEVARRRPSEAAPR